MTALPLCSEKSTTVRTYDHTSLVGVPVASVVERATPEVARTPAWLRRVFGVLGRWSPELAARVAEPLFFRPRRHAPPAREAAWLRSATTRELRLGDRTIAVSTWGVGPPVLLVHGWEGRAGQMGGLGVALAEEGFKAIAFDAPAHGDSSGRSVAMFEFVEVIHALAAQSGGLAGIIGHSMGAAAATRALFEDLPAAHAVLLAPPRSLADVVRGFAAQLGLPSAAERAFGRRLEARFGADIWERASPVQLAPHVRTPALIVHDQDDADVPLEEGRAVSSAWPGARLLVTSGLGHRRVLRDTAVCGAVAAALRSTTLDRTTPFAEETRHV